MRPLHSPAFIRVTFAFLAAFALFPSLSRAEAFDLIIAGCGGELAYEERFQQWGEALVNFLVEESGHDRANVHLLLASPAGEGSAAIPTSLENIDRQFAELQDKVTPEDDVFVFLIGHGSHLRGVSKFQIPGPDLIPEVLDDFISVLDARQIVVINASSCSGGFINALSREGRIIATATKNPGERNATLFMQSFVQGLSDGSADLNHDERISVLEACQRAATITEDWYNNEDLIQTEHSLLDDNGDGLGSRPRMFSRTANDADAARKKNDSILDGAIAERTYIRDFVFPDYVPLELVERYRTGLLAVETLRDNKGDYEPGLYYAELEELLIVVARTNHEIRSMIMAAQEAEEAAKSIGQEPDAETTEIPTIDDASAILQNSDASPATDTEDISN